MKQVILIIFISLMFSCSKEKDTCFNGVKDGSEINIDCGGNCQPCSNSNNSSNTNTFNPSINKIQGTWFLNGKLTQDMWTNYGGYDSIVHLWVKISNGCRLELTNTIVSTNPHISYERFGSLEFCSYPIDTGTYSYEQTSGILNSYYHVDKATNDSMILSTTIHTTYDTLIYSKNPLFLNDTDTIDWNVTLKNTYPHNNHYAILLVSSHNTAETYDTIPITNNQTIYSGTKVMTTGLSRELELKIIQLNWPSSNYYLTLNTRMNVRGTNLYAKSRTLTFCNGTSCLGVQQATLDPINIISWSAF